MGEEQKMTKEEYNAIPVHYCRDCLSLNIRNIDGPDSMPFCDECGSTTVLQCDIETWEQLYKIRYNKSYLNS